MDGYSKGDGPEHPNKITLLCNKLTNPILPYLGRCSEIVIYEQNAVLPKSLHQEVLILGRDNFWPKQQWVEKTPQLMEFLTNYYTIYVKTGQMPSREDRRKNARQPFYFEDLDHSKYNFSSLDELKAFCIEKTPVYSRQCMLTWYNIHAQFQPELFDTDDRAALQHQINTSATAEAAQAALEEMHRKFTRKM